MLKSNGTRFFKIVAADSVTKDKVSAYLTIDQLAGNSHSEWGIPVDLPLGRLWHLATIRPRQELAKGGTKALIDGLGRFADAAKAWVTTEVQALDSTRDQLLMRLLRKHGAFVWRRGYGRLMRREPR